MYTIGGITFFEKADPDFLIIHEYYRYGVPQDEKAHASSLGERAEIELFKKVTSEVTDAISNGAKERVVFLTNLGIVKEESAKYEDHWLKMLGNNGLHFNPSIIKLKTVDLAATMKQFGIPYSNKFFDGLMTYNETRFLCMNVLSSLTDENNRHLGLTPSLAKTLVTQFNGSYIDPEIGNNNCRLYIKYAPAGDISAIVMLNRYLHMYL